MRSVEEKIHNFASMRVQVFTYLSWATLLSKLNCYKSKLCLNRTGFYKVQIKLIEADFHTVESLLVTYLLIEYG